MFSPLCPMRSTQHMVYESTKWTSRKQVEGGIQNRLREEGWPSRGGGGGGRGRRAAFKVADGGQHFQPH